MTCSRCGQNVPEGARSCPSCGTALSRERSGAADRLRGATDGGPLGPLQDFVLRGDPSPVRSPPVRRRSSPLLQFRSEDARSEPPGRQHRTDRQTPRPAAEALLAFESGTGSLAVSRQESRAASVEQPRLLSRRLLAGVLDVLILLGINATVVYFTLRLAGLSVAEVGGLPPGPLLAFLLLFDAGYLVVLTAFGGQTIGKMAAGLRVERQGGDPVTPVGALVRTAAYSVSVLPAGLGFLGVFSSYGRPLHDVLAHTRVVKV